MKLELSKIFIDHSINIRDGLDDETIETYMEIFDQLPSVIVFKLTGMPSEISDTVLKGQGMYLLADGFHRVAAARKLGKTEIEVDIREGTREDAEEWALLANLRHGKPLTRAERKKAVERMLMLHPERANVWIAEDMGVSEHTVKKYRDDLESGSQIAIVSKPDNTEKLVGKESGSEFPIVTEFIGRDGKKYPRERKQPSWRDNASPKVLECVDKNVFSKEVGKELIKYDQKVQDIIAQQIENMIIRPKTEEILAKLSYLSEMFTNAEKTGLLSSYPESIQVWAKSQFPQTIKDKKAEVLPLQPPTTPEIKRDFLKMHNDFMELKGKFVLIETDSGKYKGVLREIMFFPDDGRGGDLKLFTHHDKPPYAEVMVTILYTDIIFYHLIEEPTYWEKEGYPTQEEYDKVYAVMEDEDDTEPTPPISPIVIPGSTIIEDEKGMGTVPAPINSVVPYLTAGRQPLSSLKADRRALSSAGEILTWQDCMIYQSRIEEYSFALAKSDDVMTLQNLLASLKLLVERMEMVFKDVVEGLEK
jgi:hypothetical protein